MEKSESKKTIKNIKHYIVILILAAFCITTNIIARKSTVFSEWYATSVYPVLVNTLGRFCGLFPFSVFELLIIVAIILVICGITKIIIHMIKHRFGHAYRILLDGIILALSIYAVFLINCGINYHRLPFSYYLDVEITKNDTETLKEFTEYLIAESNSLAEEISTKNAYVGNTDCGEVLSLDYNGSKSLSEVHRTAVDAMNLLGEKYPALSGYYPKPKPVFFSIVMSYENITGVYSAYFIEANYNRLITDYDKAYTICHELSHLRGFMREDEANFIAYLACIGSDDINFRYSGYIGALIHTLNALYANINHDIYWEVYDTLCDQVKRDIHYNNLYWKQFETPVATVSEAVNNVYLISNAQTDGTKSYGRCVDLFLAYYLKYQK